jgi:hypothetical protein
VIVHQRQPSKNSCGQTCVAMLLGVPAADVIASIPDKTGTVASQLGSYIIRAGGRCDQRCQRGWARPPTALCRVRWGGDPKDRRAHWVLWAEGEFWDPLVPGRALFLRSPHGRVLSYLACSAVGSS